MDFNCVDGILLSLPDCVGTAEQVIAESLSEEEIVGLKEMFESMDTDNSGTITLEELKVGLARQGSRISDNEVKQLMEAVR